MLVLMLDNDMSRNIRRTRHLEGMGIHVSSACSQLQALRALTTPNVDVVCIAGQFVPNREEEVVMLSKCLTPKIPVALIVESTPIPSVMEQIVDVVIDSATFDLRGASVIQQMSSGQTSFFWQWIEEWTSRASLMTADRAAEKC